MDLIRKEQIDGKVFLGRTLWRVMGHSAPWEDEISAGFARFSLERGVMKAHRHEREVIYVLDAHGASARFGYELETMDHKTELHAGDVLRFHDREWHIFDLEDETSFLDIFWVFSVPQNHTEDAN